MSGYGSTFLVYFHPHGLSGDIIGVRVDAPTFAAVEDWAWSSENVPAGCYLASIEKHYGTDAALSIYGAADVNLWSERRAS